MNNNYDDIINFKYIPKNIISIKDRAAIFAPFSALSGYDKSISEAGRITEIKRTLGEYQISIINEKLNLIKIKGIKNICITYFVKDKFKNGGKYITEEFMIKRIDLCDKQIIGYDNQRISFCDIIDIVL